ncbi:MAG: alanine--tRNA ligase [Kiritimatiellia bacterium]
MTADELREMYLGFFADKGHAVISGSSLIPENDPSVLFTTAGMHPLVPYLLGEPHPAGKRLCDCQKCIRTGDIESVGDTHHLTFFEMLGNWSLGDYFKEEAIAWSFEFLTSKQYLGFAPESLFISVFAGNDTVPPDEESAGTWKQCGVSAERIFALPESDNWWGIPGGQGPCGPDTEMFIDTGKPECSPDCRPGCSCGKYFEIWNDVFMQYNKKADGSFSSLKQHNVDTGMGLERTAAMLQNKPSVFDTGLFSPVIEAVSDGSGRKMNENPQTSLSFRVIADHIRSATFILGDQQGITPGNLGQGYVLRRLIRGAVRHAKNIGLKPGFSESLAKAVIANYRHVYTELEDNALRIIEELKTEEEKFENTLDRGMAELNKVLDRMKEHGQTTLSGRVAFRLYDTSGFPLEFTEEICREEGMNVDKEGFQKAFEKHKAVSKQGSEKAFKGGLADASGETTKLHTATHLLQQALRKVLGDHVKQKGSNITPERLRFDFSHPAKMAPDEIRKTEDIVNDVIRRGLPVVMETKSLEEAGKEGAVALFSGKYGEQVKVYSIGDFSKEVCGGPHVNNTGELGHFKIKKEESSSAGVRRIRAVLLRE